MEVHTMTMEEILTSGLAELGVPATAAQLSQLRAYYTLLEKLDALDADEQAAMCEKLHELAEELQNSIQTRFEAESGTGV